MLYRPGENLDANVEDIAKAILEGTIILIPTQAVATQQFLTTYMQVHNLKSAALAYYAFTESELDSRFSTYANVKQYKDFIALDLKETKAVLAAVVDLEEPESDSGWLSDAASKADGSGE